MDLATIENCYGSVAEYFRCCDEQDSREAEYAEARQKKYARNRKKLAEAYAVIEYGGNGVCNGCEYADFDTMTSPEDDMELVICNAPDGHNCSTREYALLPERYIVSGVAEDDPEDTIEFGFKLEDELNAFLKEAGDLYLHPNGKAYALTVSEHLAS